MKKNLSLLLAVIILGVGLFYLQVNAQDESTPTSQMVAQNCSSAQTYLKTILKPRDLRARVDRLQAYSYVYQRMDVFVSRLERNNQPQAVELRQTATNLQTSTKSFKDDYESYDQAREKLTNLSDCSKHASEFEQLLNDARNKRAQVSSDVASIKVLLNETFQTELQSLYQQLLSTNKSGKQ